MVRFVLLLVIRLYWTLVPARWRRSCLFRVSCSHFVFDALMSQGVSAGCRAFALRWRRCRAGFHVELDNGRVVVRCADGSTCEPNEVVEGPVDAFYQTMAEAQGMVHRRIGSEV